jgi:hypothetical protein
MRPSIPVPPPTSPAPQATTSPSAKPPLSPPETAQAAVRVDHDAPASAPASDAPVPAENGDLDGARLVALNMELNGEPREDAERYLAENYQLADRQKLIDEVYEAIDG